MVLQVTDGEIVSIGARAAALLQDEVLLAALDMLRDGCIDDWKAAETVEERERCHAQLVAANEMAKRLQAIAAHGKHIAEKMEQRREKASRTR